MSEEIKQKAREGLDELMTDENMSNYKAHTKTNVYNLFEELFSQALQKRETEIKNIILRRTEIPKGARNPTRDATVILGEQLVQLIENSSTLTTK